MRDSYGVFVSDQEVQQHLHSLVCGLFPIVRGSVTEPDALAPGRGTSEVGASITPTSGH